MCVARAGGGRGEGGGGLGVGRRGRGWRHMPDRGVVSVAGLLRLGRRAFPAVG